MKRKQRRTKETKKGTRRSTYDIVVVTEEVPRHELEVAVDVLLLHDVLDPVDRLLVTVRHERSVERAELALQSVVVVVVPLHDVGGRTASLTSTCAQKKRVL